MKPKPQTNFDKFKELIDSLNVGDAFTRKQLLVHADCYYSGDNVAIDNIRNQASKTGFVEMLGNGVYRKTKEFTFTKGSDLVKAYLNRNKTA